MMRVVFVLFIALLAIGFVIGCGGNGSNEDQGSAQEQMGQTENANMAADVVCGMQVDTTKTQYSTEYEGKTYYFCSEDCKNTFVANPEEYVMHEHQEMEN